MRSPMLKLNEEKLQQLADDAHGIILDDHIKYNRERREAKISLQQFRSQASRELMALVKQQQEELQQQIQGTQQEQGLSSRKKKYADVQSSYSKASLAKGVRLPRMSNSKEELQASPPNQADQPSEPRPDPLQGSPAMR